MPSKPLVVVVAIVYPPDNYSGAARPYRFVKYLRELGYPVEVVAGTLARAAVSENGVHRLHAAFDAAPKDSFFEKVARKFFLPHDEGVGWAFAVASFAARWRAERPILLSTAPPFTTHLAAYLLKRRYGWKWIADFRDPMAGNPYRSLQSPWLDRTLQNAFFRSADGLIANTAPVAELWRREYPHDAGKIHQIWNGYDPEESLGPAPVPPQPRRILRHVGSVYGDRYPVMLLDSVRRLIAAGRLDADAFLIDLVGPLEAVGAVPDDAWFQRVAPVPKDEASRLITVTDYLLLLDVTQANTGLQVPAKIFDYIRIGRPVLACTVEQSPVDWIMRQSGVPYVGLYPSDSAAARDAKVERFFQLSNTPVKASAWFEENFDGRRQAHRLAALIDELA